MKSLLSKKVQIKEAELQNLFDFIKSKLFPVDLVFGRYMITNGEIFDLGQQRYIMEFSFRNVFNGKKQKMTLNASD